MVCEAVSRPLAALSGRVLRLLLGLALERDIAARVYTELRGDRHVEFVREAVVLDDLISAVRTSTQAARRLDAILADQMGAEADRYHGRSLFELAALWARERHILRGRALAALLWTVARRDATVFRTFEARLAEEIEVLALRTLAAQPPTECQHDQQP